MRGDVIRRGMAAGRPASARVQGAAIYEGCRRKSTSRSGARRDLTAALGPANLAAVGIAGERAGMGAGAHGLSIERLSKRYGEVAAVDDVSLAVERGRFLT